MKKSNLKVTRKPTLGSVLAGVAGALLTTLGVQGLANAYCPHTFAVEGGWGAFGSCNSSHHCVSYKYADGCGNQSDDYDAATNNECYLVGQVFPGYRWATCSLQNGSYNCNINQIQGGGGTHTHRDTKGCPI